MINANVKANRYTRHFNAAMRLNIIPLTRLQFEELYP